MTKIYNWVENNAIKALIVTTILVTFIFGTAYVLSMKNDVREIQKQCLIQSRLVQDNIKPEYNTLKSHTVFIIGCSGGVDVSAKLINLIGDDEDEAGGCWAGTGVVIKVTNTETYILTNNHVAGKQENNPIIYVENEESKIEAEIVKYHDYLDIAVIKVKGQLIGKTPIPGITTVFIQDPVYVVGHPLAVKYVYSEGVVAGYKGTSMLLQIPCIYGNSGSGVYNKDGKLAGLVFALEVYPGFAGIPEARITHALIVDSESIQLFLKDLDLFNQGE